MPAAAAILGWTMPCATSILRRLALPALLSALAIGACGSDDPPAAGPPADEARFELHPWVTELGPEALAALVAKDDPAGVLRFRGAPASVVARKPGDVIVAGKSDATPRGLLRGVALVESAGEETLVRTFPVPLPLAFKSLHAKLDRGTRDIADPSGPPVSPRSYKTSKQVGGKRIFHDPVYNQDGNEDSKSDQLIVHAEIEGQVGYSAAVDLDWLDDPNVLAQAKQCLEKIAKGDVSGAFSDCTPMPDVKVSFSASLSGNSVLDVDGASSKAYESKTIYLNETPWDLGQFVVGPVVITPELDFTAKVMGDASTYFHARTEFGYDVSASAAAGLKNAVKLSPPKFTKKYATPVVEVTSTGISKASFGPRLSLLAYDSFGFYADLHGYGLLEADQGKTPCWDYTIGAELTPGVRVQVPWKLFGLEKLAAKLGWTGDLFAGEIGTVELYKEHPFENASPDVRACKKPPESALPLGEGPTNETYQSPTFAPWSFRYGGVAALQPFSVEPGQSHVLVEKGHDASWIVSGAFVGAVLAIGDAGDVRWARQIELGRLPDEDALALERKAAGVLAQPQKDLSILAFADRLTVLSLDYYGDLGWAKRLRVAAGLPDEELRALLPVAMTPLPSGDVAVLYSRRTVATARNGGELLLLRLAPNGSVRFAKRFRFPTGETSLGSALVGFDDDLFVTGFSFQPTETAPYVLRFGSSGELTLAKRVTACGATRSRIDSGARRASGDLAFFGSYEMSPQRTFFVTMSPDLAVRSAAAIWTGSNVQDITAVALAELPTSGFVTLAEHTPYVYTANSVQLSTHDALGVRTGGSGYWLKNEAGTANTYVRPAGLRLTTDGGALVVAHVTQDKELNDHGLWVSKLPARTFEASFDPTYVTPADSTFPPQPCEVTTSDAAIVVTDVELDGLDVTAIMKANALAPVREKRAL